MNKAEQTLSRQSLKHPWQPETKIMKSRKKWGNENNKDKSKKKSK